MGNPLTFLMAIILPIAAAKATTSSPKSTLGIERGLQTGFSPKPTARALLGGRLDNLFERQVALETCGYYNGYPQECAAGYQCVINSAHFAAGCCPSSASYDCTLYTTCVNYGESCPGCSGNPYVGYCTNSLYPSCFAKIWNYAIQYTEWDCATVSGTVTYAENPVLVSTTTFGDTTSTSNLIPVISQTTTVTVSASQATGGNGNGNGNGVNGQGNTQNNGDGNINNYYGSNPSSSVANWDALTPGLVLMLQLHVFLALSHLGTWV